MQNSGFLLIFPTYIFRQKRLPQSWLSSYAYAHKAVFVEKVGELPRPLPEQNGWPPYEVQNAAVGGRLYLMDV